MGAGEAGPAGDKGDKGNDGPPGATSWTAMNTDQKDEAILKLKAAIPTDSIKGPPGPPGPTGPTGVTTIDTNNVTTLSNTLAANGTFRGQIADDLGGKNDFKTGIATSLVNNTILGFTDSAATKLSANIDFVGAVATNLKNNHTATLKGADGDIANFSSLKTSVKPKVLWCADGEFCNVPINQTNVNTGLIDTSKTTKGIQLKETQQLSLSDLNNGLAHRDAFGNKVGTNDKFFEKDGPFLYGKGGGQLGHVNGAEKDWALRWNETKDVGVNNILYANNIRGKEIRGADSISIKAPNLYMTSDAHYGYKMEGGSNTIVGDLTIRHGNVTINDSRSLSVANTVNVPRINLGNGWAISGESDRLAFYKDDVYKAAFHSDNKLAVEKINLGHNWAWVGKADRMELQKDNNYKQHFAP